MPSTFESRLRDHLADDDFDESINQFMKKYSRQVLSKNVKDDAGCKDSKIEIDSNEYTLESYNIWHNYLNMIETHLLLMQEAEMLTSVEFKEKIENVAKSNPMLVRLMIASWEFQQFIEICKEYNEAMEENDNNDDNDIAESKNNDNNNNDDEKDCK